jgi:hypothetical protein
VTTATT